MGVCSICWVRNRRAQPFQRVPVGKNPQQCNSSYSYIFAEILPTEETMKWVTREKARVDRIACPWLIRKFIDKGAEFLYVPKEKVMEVVQKDGATPFDTPGAELHHYEENGKEFVSFDAIIKKYKLTDPALLELAKIVRVADGGSGSEIEAAGLEAAATGFRMMAKDDFENQRLQFPLYDALYTYCKWKVEEKGKLEHTGH